jgi:DNA-binding response OmpR family regulator
MAEKILIVDDDPNALRLIGYALQRQGYQIVIAQDGQEALAKVQSEKPDLIILDVMMPAMDGHQVLKHLRAHPATARVPVILFTAKSQVDDKIAGFEAGADDYLSKPVTPAELVARVKALLLRASYTTSTAVTPGARVIGFLGVQGGVGTTSVAINVAVALSREDKKVALIECQPHTGTVARRMGLQPRRSLAFLSQQKPSAIDKSVIESCSTQYQTGMLVIPAPVELTRNSQPLTSAHAEALTKHLDDLAEIVILDLGSQVGPAVRRLLGRCDHVILVTEATETSLALTQMLLQKSREGETLGMRSNAPIQVVVVNRTRMAVSLTRTDVEKTLGLELLAFITPAPELFRQAARESRPALLTQPDGLHAGVFKQLAETLA